MMKLYKTISLICSSLILALIFGGGVSLAPKSALAACCSCFDAGCYNARTSATSDQSREEMFQGNDATVPTVAYRVANELSGHRQWLVNTVWEDNLLPALMLMADQLSATAMYQTQIIGSFFDAKHQLETQRVLQTLRAKAHKEYHPSAGMCTFGSTAKSLASSERRGELSQHVMSQRFQDRMMGNANTAAAQGPASDMRSRLRQYREKFCDPMDNNGGLFFLCDHDQDPANGTAPAGATNPSRMNKDIDFLRTVDFPMTLNLDFTDTNITDEEEEIIALGDNLYGQNVFPRISGAFFEETQDEALSAPRQAIMDARAILAKLSVAYNSYNSLTGMKASGTGGSRAFMEAALEELGISPTPTSGSGVDEITRMLGYDTATGEEIAPSYNAQMEILTKKIYQNPDFYTGLYDKPVNVERKKVAMQAIGLMQKFDLFKSYLRNEMNTSILLEIAVEDLQAKLENDLREQSEEGLN